MTAIVCPNPWLCQNWLKHCSEKCNCRETRNNALVTPNLGLASEEEAKTVISSAINQLVKHKTFGYNSVFINFARDFDIGTVVNPWLSKCMYDAIMAFGDELNEKSMSPSRFSLQPEGFNLAPEYFFPSMIRAINMFKDPATFLLHYVDNNSVVASKLTAAGTAA